MKKFLIAAAGLGALAAAAPAAAQYYPAPQYGYGQPVHYGYGQPQGYGYGYNNRDQQGLIRSYIVRADQLRQRVERLDSRDRITEREARRLRDAAADLQRRAREYARGGLSFNERRDLDIRLAQLQQRIQIDRRDGRQMADRDRDGRWDSRDSWIDRNRNGVDDRQEGLYRPDRDRDGVYDGRDGWVDRNRNGVDDRYEQRRWDRDDD
jgi:opacity protein-like surface antigen